MEVKSKSCRCTKKHTCSHLIRAVSKLSGTRTVFMSGGNVRCDESEEKRRCVFFSSQSSFPLFFFSSPIRVSHPSITAALPLQPTPLRAHSQFPFIQRHTLMVSQCASCFEHCFCGDQFQLHLYELAGLVHSCDVTTHIIEASSSKTFSLFNKDFKQLCKGLICFLGNA